MHTAQRVIHITNRKLTCTIFSMTAHKRGNDTKAIHILLKLFYFCKSRETCSDLCINTDNDLKIVINLLNKRDLHRYAYVPRPTILSKR